MLYEAQNELLWLHAVPCSVYLRNTRWFHIQIVSTSFLEVKLKNILGKFSLFITIGYFASKYCMAGVRFVRHITFWQLPVSVALKLTVQILNSWRFVVELNVIKMHSLQRYNLHFLVLSPKYVGLYAKIICKCVSYFST